ncbi:hypothetical protein Bccel_1925 [Pseudobacteroides cellulosolvens ATCC 35603 = DSM 2933]|uniref:Uncharacterized protein n=1 Tax=Pseudobacteroides cellulosolvens ATCC 35603 = DSM 2933 TaxID=398512 RepID=A0A0L6JLN9_9FIRM|nr:hypothetical protein Bccel_1925 [Pseudobacteroides cellulosolvens ATCC 35603 = DSM 2933]
MVIIMNDKNRLIEVINKKLDKISLHMESLN